MFARYFVELQIPPEAVEHALSRNPREWLPVLAEQANLKGDRLLAEIGLGETIRLQRKVIIELGPAVRATSKTFFPLRWTPSGHTGGLFPALDADLEVAALGADRTHLAMSAQYVPPLGVVGQAIDRAFLSRVAEATLKNFLDGVADAIMSERGARGSRHARLPAASDPDANIG